MELPHNISSSTAVLQHKLQAFQALRGLQKSSAILGQYQAYSGQVRQELQKPDGFQSLTPTFAGRHQSWPLWGPHPLEAAVPPSALCSVVAETPRDLFSAWRSPPPRPAASLKLQVTYLSLRSVPENLWDSDRYHLHRLCLSLP